MPLAPPAPLPSPRGSKRKPRERKSEIACEDCRIRKRKCDGVRPVCGTCAKRVSRGPCIFDRARMNRAKDASYIESLRSRIKELEAYNKFDRSTGVRIDSDCQATPLPVEQASSPPAAILLEDIERSLLAHVNQQGEECSRFGKTPAARLEISGSPYPASNPPSESKLVNNLGSHGPEIHHAHDFQAGGRDIGTTAEDATNGPSGISPTESAYFGSSSSFSFMDQVQSVLNMTESWLAEGERGEPMSNAPHNIGDDLGPPSIAYPAAGDPDGWRHQARSVFEDFALPRRADADALAETYFIWTHSLYPFLDEPWFRKRHEKLWTTAGNEHKCQHSPGSQPKFPWSTRQDTSANDGSLRTDDVLFYCLVNLVYAMGCQFHSTIDPRDRRRESDIFYQRAKRLLGLDFDMMNQGSTLLVQTFLIMGQYLQSTEMIGASWNCVGVAIRTAQAIGLHLDSSKQSKVRSLNQSQYDLRLRLWGGCLLFDRALSMAYGRPLMITSGSSSNLAGSFLLKENCSANLQDGISSVKNNPLISRPFYIEALKLLGILEETLLAFYRGKNTLLPSAPGFEKQPRLRTNMADSSPSIDIIKVGDFQVVLSLDSALTSWHDNIPPMLRWLSGRDDTSYEKIVESTAEPVPDILFRQIAVLQARFFHARILLFRPLLSQLFARSRPSVSHTDGPERVNSTLQEVLVVQASKMCVSSAQNLADLIAGGMERDALPEWWFNVLYIYTCATVLLVASVCPSIREDIGPQSLKDSWAKCLNCLQTYQIRSRFARRCYKFLELIDQRVISTLSNSSTRPRTASASKDPSADSQDTPDHMRGSGSFQAEMAMPLNYQQMELEISGGRPSFPSNNACVSDISVESMAYAMDMGWLSSVPFEMDFENDAMVGSVLQ